MQQHGSSGLGQPAPGSPRTALHTAASTIWHSSSSPEPPQRSASPTKLGGRFSRGPGPPSRPGSPRKSLLLSPKAVAKQHQEKADEVGLPAAAACFLQHMSAQQGARDSDTQHTRLLSDLAQPSHLPGALACAVLCGAGRWSTQGQQDQAPDWHSGVRHAGWLWRRFGHGHKATWKKLWVSNVTAPPPPAAALAAAAVVRK